jgi:hypothetical protein
MCYFQFLLYNSLQNVTLEAINYCIIHQFILWFKVCNHLAISCDTFQVTSNYSTVKEINGYSF